MAYLIWNWFKPKIIEGNTGGNKSTPVVTTLALPTGGSSASGGPSDPVGPSAPTGPNAPPPQIPTDDTDAKRKESEATEARIKATADVKKADNIVPTSSGFLGQQGVLAGASSVVSSPIDAGNAESTGGFNVCLKITPIGEEDESKSGTSQTPETEAKEVEMKKEAASCKTDQYKNSLTGRCQQCEGEWNSSMAECVRPEAKGLFLVGVIQSSSCSSIPAPIVLATEDEVKAAWGVGAIKTDVKAVCADDKSLDWSVKENKWASAAAAKNECSSASDHKGAVWVKVPLTKDTLFSAENGLPPIPTGWSWESHTVALHSPKKE